MNQPAPRLFWLLAAAACTVVIWQLPNGNYFFYPFSILATWFHEMGHGVSAALLGGKFEQLLLFPDGSGMAAHRGPLYFGDWGKAAVAAGGPLAPALAGAWFIISGRSPGYARFSLLLLASVLLISTIVWVRSPFGLLAIPLWTLLIMIIALQFSRAVQMFSIQFLGVQACVSSYQQVGYLFMDKAEIHGQLMLSDTAKIAQYIGFSYWFWGIVLALASLLILLLSLRWAFR
jgi:hypothetical protein